MTTQKVKNEYRKVAARERLWATEAIKDARYALRQAKIAQHKGHAIEAKDWRREAGVGFYWAARRRKEAMKEMKKTK